MVADSGWKKRNAPPFIFDGQNGARRNPLSFIIRNQGQKPTYLIHENKALGTHNNMRGAGTKLWVSAC
jgi:hypothetical protein